MLFEARIRYVNDVAERHLLGRLLVGVLGLLLLLLRARSLAAAASASAAPAPADVLFVGARCFFRAGHLFSERVTFSILGAQTKTRRGQPTSIKARKERQRDAFPAV